jgi:U3 small nucleolar RNA-associated protein 5
MEQMPDLVARLAGLHATLTARLALRESLLSLSGRLDMVLQQVDLRASTARAPLARNGKGGRTPTPGKGGEPRRYVEGASEEEEAADAMDVELEEGSDVGSVEDVELGAESGSGAGSDVDEEDDEDEDEDEDGDEELDEGEDSEEDSEEDESLRLNGFIDDEAEEDEESESE